MRKRKILFAVMIAAAVGAVGLSFSHVTRAKTAQDAASAFPCPSGDASCGNGAASDDQGPAPPINGQGASAQNSVPDSNPDQKIEDTPQGDVDQGVTDDIEEMNREGGAHSVNRPK